MSEPLRRTLTAIVVSTLLFALVKYEEWGTGRFFVEFLVFGGGFALMWYVVERHTNWLGRE